MGYRSVHNLFSYRGHRQSDRHTQTVTQTNAGKHILRRFRGEKYRNVKYRDV